ncbi:hypothetical protein ACFQBQ_16445 [Granulicella cerasi]|uniref:DUF6908 domain-containing protein n=1 Tax=Granulicella cerasi TaxID=741063 RepID=A0ABW1ZDF1_9BACT
MRDPKTCFEPGFAGGAHLNPFYWRNDLVGGKQWAVLFRRALTASTLNCANSTRALLGFGTRPCRVEVRGGFHGQAHSGLALT